GHDAVAADIAGDVDDAAYIPHAQAVAEYPFAPRKLVGGLFDGGDPRDVEVVHRPHLDPRKCFFKLDARHARKPPVRTSSPPMPCACPPACATGTPDDR